MKSTSHLSVEELVANITPPVVASLQTMSYDCLFSIKLPIAKQAGVNIGLNRDPASVEKHGGTRWDCAWRNGDVAMSEGLRDRFTREASE